MWFFALALVDLGELGSGVWEEEFPRCIEGADAPVAVGAEVGPGESETEAEDGVAGPVGAEGDAGEHHDGDECPDEGSESSIECAEEDCGDDGVGGVCGGKGHGGVGEAFVEGDGRALEEIGVIVLRSCASDDDFEGVEEESADCGGEDPVEGASESIALEERNDDEDESDGGGGAKLLDGFEFAPEVTLWCDGAECLGDGPIDQDTQE